MHLESPNTSSLSRAQPSNKIRDSWQRCLDAGLDPAQVPREVDACSQELRELIDQESVLLHVVRKEFRRLQNQLPGDHWLLGVANRNAVLVEVVCSNPTVRSASRAVPGSCWKEKFRGTNAIGTAAFSRGPVLVTLHEHFLRHYNTLTCAAATINDPDDEIVGVIHASSNNPVRQRHTASLLCMSARRIESELFKERYRSQIILQFHSRDEFAETMDAGLIALDEEGKVLGTNRQARVLLEDLPLHMGRHFDEIFRVPFRQFMAKTKFADGIVQLADLKGSFSAVRVHGSGNRTMRWSNSPGLLESQEPAKPVPAFVCSDPVVSRAVFMIQSAVSVAAPILICGETGTGKELLAQYAHQLSRRRGRFVAVNCAAVPESLIEAELFGYREGAFTGARSGGAEGLILQADGGTLFLDEIGDMSLKVQPALLRVLDSWTLRPIGSNRELKVDVQLITATNCDLEQAIAEKRFRSDLLHRINSVEILLPPLRKRSDFDEIVRDLLGQVSPHLEITEDALSLLRAQYWCGNMRELRNVLVRSALTCTALILSAADIEPFLRRHLDDNIRVRSEAPSLLELRRNAIVEAYKINNGNISKAAQALRVSRNTLYRELRHAGLIDKGTGRTTPPRTNRTHNIPR